MVLIICSFMAFLNTLGLSQDALKKDLWKTLSFDVYLPNVCLMTYKKLGNHFLISKMSYKHNTSSQPNLGVLQTSDSACEPLNKLKFSKWRLSLKLINITKKNNGFWLKQTLATNDVHQQSWDRRCQKSWESGESCSLNKKWNSVIIILRLWS